MSKKQEVPQEDLADELDFNQEALSLWNPDELVPVSSGGSAPTELYTSVPDMDDMAMPRIRLAQGLTPEVMEGAARAGDWLIPGQEPSNKITVMLYGLKITRELRIRDGDNRSVQCAAPDGEFGVGDPGGPCRSCEFASGARNETTGKWVPPLCTKQYRYLAQTEDGQFYEIVFQKTASGAARTLNPFIAAKQPNECLMVRLGSTLQRDREKSWVTPTVEAVRVVPRP